MKLKLKIKIETVLTKKPNEYEHNIYATKLKKI